jgi:peptide/nickel transport system substrate-binding protein/oligopeptide transport system substrate-binding protein
MRTGKKFTIGFLPTLLVVMTMLITACEGGGTTPNSSTNAPTHAPQDKQFYRFPVTGQSDIATFDPALDQDLYSLFAIQMIYTGLVQFGDDLNVKGQLAQSWDQSSNGLTWTFHLKPNLKFSDGTPLTSKDVAYSIDRALQPTTKSPAAGAYMNLILDSDKLQAGKITTIIGDSVLTPDDSTVVIKANKRAAYFLDALAYPTSWVVERSLTEKYGTKFTDHLNEGGGAGPFMVQQYIHSKEIDFVPNPNYYGPKPQLHKVTLFFYKTVKTAYQAYQVGQLDIATIPSANLAQARTLTNQFHQTPTLSIDYYAMNYLVKPFDNIKIRQAFELAINKNEIVHAIWKDRFIPSNHIVPQGMPGYNPDLTGPDGVKGTSGYPAKAKQLFQQGLREEGYLSVSQLPPIKLTYSTGSQEFDNEVAALRQVWQTILGVDVKPDAVDFNKLIDELNASINNSKGVQFYGLGWIADYPDPQDWTTLQFDKGSLNNYPNYGQNNSAAAAQQQATQQLLEQADLNLDQTARLKLYNQAEQQLVNDVAWLPMEQETVVRLLKPYVIGRKFNAQNLIPPDDWANIYIGQH